MKKILIIILAIFMLTGCKSITRQLDEEKYNAYLTYYQSILEADNKLSSSSNFDSEIVVNKIDDNTYRYDVIIDNPRVAMIDIKAIAAPDGFELEIDKENMMPSIGILDDLKKSMVPGQINLEKDYVGGLILSLASNNKALKITVMVDWKDLSGINSHREYVSIYAEYIEPEVNE